MVVALLFVFVLAAAVAVERSRLRRGPVLALALVLVLSLLSLPSLLPLLTASSVGLSVLAPARFAAVLELAFASGVSLELVLAASLGSPLVSIGLALLSGPALVLLPLRLSL